jgi:hypothetical protein
MHLLRVMPGGAAFSEWGMKKRGRLKVEVSLGDLRFPRFFLDGRRPHFSPPPPSGGGENKRLRFVFSLHF